MFWDLRLLMSEPPWPAQPMAAMLSFSLADSAPPRPRTWEGTMLKAVEAKAVRVRKERREIDGLIFMCLVRLLWLERMIGENDRKPNTKYQGIPKTSQRSRF